LILGREKTSVVAVRVPSSTHKRMKFIAARDIRALPTSLNLGGKGHDTAVVAALMSSMMHSATRLLMMKMG
jgi:hypothetical protein